MRLCHPARADGKKVVIVIGGGFAGLNAAKFLARHAEVHVLIFDQRNHHLFQPLLYQVATAGLSPGDIAVPIRAQFASAPNVEVHLGRVEAVDLLQQVVVVGEYEIEYDYVVIGIGAQHSYFGRPEWEEHAPGLKTLEQATEIRRRILAAFEYAENELDEEKQRAALTFVVVGGGPTGVELAGAIADIARTVMVSDFRRIDPSKAQVLLVEAAPRILTAFPEDLGARAHRDLEELGVQVMTNAMVGHIDGDGVIVAGTRIPSRTVVWAAGVQASPMEFRPEVPRDRAGRVQVEPDLSIPGFPTAFAAGDMIALPQGDGTLVPGVAPAAIQGGPAAARNVIRSIRHQERLPFRYWDKGIMATIGKSRAVGIAMGLKMTGRMAWLAWLFIHIYYLVGFKNRIGVIWTWGWSYLFSKRGARLITERDWRLSSGTQQ